MYQVSCDIGKSAGTDVSFVQTAIATALGQGKVALLLGENTGVNGGEVMKRAAFAMEQLIDKIRNDGVAQSIASERAVITGASRTVAYVTGNVVLTNENQVAAGFATVGGSYDQSTELILAALTQCWEVARETINTRTTTIVA
jgi:hypothetical protein